jgi:hypothetical protein
MVGLLLYKTDRERRMTATLETDKALMKFYRDLGYTDKKLWKQPRDFDGLIAKWYKEGFDAEYPYWDILAQ